MIQANELRIGNLVRVSNGDIRKVSSLSNGKTPICTLIKGCGFSESHFSESAVDPVELTEDFLLEVGFEKNERHVHEMHPWIDYTLKGIRIQLPYFTFNFGDEDEQDIDVRYVHQLQNLYFALTGKELAWPT